MTFASAIASTSLSTEENGSSADTSANRHEPKMEMFRCTKGCCNPRGMACPSIGGSNS
jgi:hypothetical protein